MNKRVKTLSTALCGLVLISGLCTTNVQAASNVANVQAIKTVQPNSYQEIVTPRFGVIFSETINSDGSSANGHITFNQLDGAVKYRCYYVHPESLTHSREDCFDFSAQSIRNHDGKIYFSSPKYNGQYNFTLVAYDSQGRIMCSELYGFRYNNGNITLNMYVNNPQI